MLTPSRGLQRATPDAALVPATTRPALVRAAAGYAAAGGFAAAALVTPVLVVFTHHHLVAAATARSVGAGAVVVVAALSAWCAALARGGLEEGARSEWWPALWTSVVVLASAGGSLGYRFSIGAGVLGTMAGCVLAVSGFTAAWAWMQRRAAADAE